MTYTLREAIAELDAAADKYVEAMRPHVAEYMANMRGVVEKSNGSGIHRRRRICASASFKQCHHATRQ